MNNKLSNANLVAFNTGIQYVQLALNVLMGLISIRLILNALGEVDYGIYDVIGGIVALLAFISTSLSQSSMRFISIRLGEGNNGRMRDTFSSCFWLHFLIATVLCIIIEAVGVFLFRGYLNIPFDRVSAAQMVYHMVSITLFANIVTTPFSALIAAYEQFWYTSLVAFINSVLKLFIAILITYNFADKLVAYGVLLCLVTLLDSFLIVAFALNKHHSDISLKIVKGAEMKTMTNFVGWTILDVLGSTINRQGYAIILNKFFGPVMNTTFALSRQVEGNLYNVSSSVVNTVKPQIMKSYGAGDYERSFRLSLTAGKFGFAMISILAIPIIVMMPDILNLWLRSYPEETVLFSRLMVIACMVEQLTRGLVFANQAVGNIKWFSIIVSTIRILALPISWLFLKNGAPAYVAIVVFLVCEVIGTLSRVVILSKISSFRISSFIESVIVKIISPVFIACLTSIVLYNLLNSLIINLLIVFAVTAFIYAVAIYVIGMTPDERGSVKVIMNTITSKLIRN